MHPCLQVEEILTVILQYLGMSKQSLWGKDEAERAKFSLVNMALACRTFCEPALDEYWREIFSIGRLLYCFPDGIARVTYRDPRRRIHWRMNHLRSGWSWVGKYNVEIAFWIYSRIGQYIERVPEPHEWTRFKRYAARVRVIRRLGLSEEISSGEHSNLTLLDVMASHFGPDPAFPGLQVLEMDGSEASAHLAQYLLFVQPQLRVFNIGICHRVVDSCPLIRSIQERAPFLEQLIMEPHVDSLGPTELSVLAGMTSMKRLSIAVHTDTTSGSDSEDSPATILSAPCLPRLEVLHISNVHLANENKSNVAALSIIELLRCTCSSSLRELRLQFGLYGNFGALHSLFVAIAAFSESLEECQITIRSNSERSSTTAPAVDEQISVGRVLSPLFSLWRSMKNLDLSDVPLSITAEDFTSMLSSWPNIRTLLLGHENKRTTSTITLVALGRAVSGCRHLEILYLRIQDSEGDPFAESGIWVHPHMMTLSIRYGGVMVDPGLAEEFLHALFPRACIDFMSDEEAKVRSEIWASSNLNEWWTTRRRYIID